MGEQEFDLASELGALSVEACQRITLYLADKDTDQEDVEDIDLFISGAMELLVGINGGVTMLPPAKGIWDVKDGNGKTIRRVNEQTYVIYSNISNSNEFVGRINELHNFLHKYGKEARQNSVMVEFMGESPDDGVVQFRSYWINDYQPYKPTR